MSMDPFAPSRRQFLSILGGAAGTALVARSPAFAEGEESPELARLIPPDKGLDPAWVRSLFERGKPTVYRKSQDDLKYIGMPIGGICCGCIYLGGDGRLWNWDIFNENQEGVLPHTVPLSEIGVTFAGKTECLPRFGVNYFDPRTPDGPGASRVEQGFAVTVGKGADRKTRRMRAADWHEVEFLGEYPIGTVTYRDPAFPIAARLEAFSPFIPLHTNDSSLPATLLHWTLSNTSKVPVEVTLAGWLQNACSLLHATEKDGNRVNRIKQGDRWTLIESRFEHTKQAREEARPDVVVADFEQDDFQKMGWTARGDTFGKGPILKSEVLGYQGEVGGIGQRIINSHASAVGADVAAKDARTGTLRSPAFRIERNFLTFHIGGGKNLKQVGLRLYVDGKVVRQATGNNSNVMRLDGFDISEFTCKDAEIEIYDLATGDWGNIGVDHIVQTDTPKSKLELDEHGDWGTMALALLDPHAHATAQVTDDRANDGKCVGELSQTIQLGPGESKTLSFIVAWHFANTRLEIDGGTRHYAKRFTNASEVADYVAEHADRLSAATRLWRDVWYDSTLPIWFLDRAMANTSILATTTCHRFSTGRFWAWEGVGCCAGTCTHVWHYVQAVGRVFPEIERDLRERVDFGVALDPKSGKIGHRGENTSPAVDGQAGRILGVYREHTMSADSAFLKRIWPKVRKATEYLLNHDTNQDGILDGAQENTLDAAWYGEIAWLSGLALAAYQAAATMADEMEDAPFAERCRQRIAAGKRAIESQLYNGEYFIQLPQPGREKAIGTYTACHIDQVFGESWLRQVSLPPVLDGKKVRSALASLYKYNFAPDVGPYRKEYPIGRAYALAGDGGIIMTTNPQSAKNPYGEYGWQTGYFNECMSGFEHQVIAHLLAEGMLEESLVCFHAIHQRYHGAARNPYNEIECSDHYSRAMASYGAFITACGFDYHGPHGHLGFAPRLQPDDFRAPFITAEGWGTYAQTRQGGTLDATLTLKHGKLRLRSLSFELAKGAQPKLAKVTLGNEAIEATLAMEGNHAVVLLGREVTLNAGSELKVVL